MLKSNTNLTVILPIKNTDIHILLCDLFLYLLLITYILPEATCHFTFRNVNFITCFQQHLRSLIKGSKPHNSALQVPPKGHFSGFVCLHMNYPIFKFWIFCLRVRMCIFLKSFSVAPLGRFPHALTDYRLIK